MGNIEYNIGESHQHIELSELTKNSNPAILELLRTKLSEFKSLDRKMEFLKSLNPKSDDSRNYTAFTRKGTLGGLPFSFTTSGRDPLSTYPNYTRYEELFPVLEKPEEADEIWRSSQNLAGDSSRIYSRLIESDDKQVSLSYSISAGSTPPDENPEYLHLIFNGTIRRLNGYRNRNPLKKEGAYPHAQSSFTFDVHGKPNENSIAFDRGTAKFQFSDARPFRSFTAIPNPDGESTLLHIVYDDSLLAQKEAKVGYHITDEEIPKWVLGTNIEEHLIREYMPGQPATGPLSHINLGLTIKNLVETATSNDMNYFKNKKFLEFE